MDISNSHFPAPPKPKYNSRRQLVLWRGLRRLFLENRLVLVPAVRDELARLDPGGLRELKKSPQFRVARMRPMEVSEYQRLDNAYTGLVTTSTANKDPADAWLVAFALANGWTVVTSELPAAQSQGKVAGVKIPDVCQSEGVSCISLDDLLQQENI